MQVKHPSIEPYERLLKSMEERLCQVEQEDNDGDQYRKAVLIVSSEIRELRKLTANGFANEDEEIAFFREVWPQFYAWLFYYIKLYRFALDGYHMSPEGVAQLTKREAATIADFYSSHEYIWPYLMTESPSIKKLFTRAHSQACIFDPLSLVLDHEFATIASHIAAWGLAYKKYYDFLQRENPEVGQRTGKTKGRKFEWRESRSAAVEWIKAVALNESVYVDGEPATTAQLVANFEETYGVDLRDFNKLLYAADARKKDATPYLTKLMNAFKGRKVMLRK